jgi:hypothetical protein
MERKRIALFVVVVLRTVARVVGVAAISTPVLAGGQGIPARHSAARSTISPSHQRWRGGKPAGPRDVNLRNCPAPQPVTESAPTQGRPWK